MRIPKTLAYGAAICATCSQMASAISLDLTSTGKQFRQSWGTDKI